MGKLFRRIEQAARGSPAPMGFAARRESPIPPILLVLIVSHAGEVPPFMEAQPDGLLLAGATDEVGAMAQVAQGVPWGVVVSPWSAPLAEEALQQGADFLVVDGGAPLEALGREGVGRVLRLPQGVAAEVAKALDPLPVDGVLLAEPVQPPLSLEAALALAVWRGKVNRPVLVEVTGLPSPRELEALRDIGVNVLLAGASAMGREVLGDLRRRLSHLSPRHPAKGRFSPLLPPPPTPQPSPPPQEEEEP